MWIAVCYRLESDFLINRFWWHFQIEIKRLTSAWSIRLSFENERESSKYHWLILKSVSIGDRISKRMEKTLPAPLVRALRFFIRAQIVLLFNSYVIFKSLLSSIVQNLVTERHSLVNWWNDGHGKTARKSN